MDEGHHATGRRERPVAQLPYVQTVVDVPGSRPCRASRSAAPRAPGSASRRLRPPRPRPPSPSGGPPSQGRAPRPLARARRPGGTPRRSTVRRTGERLPRSAARTRSCVPSRRTRAFSAQFRPPRSVTWLITTDGSTDFTNPASGAASSTSPRSAVVPRLEGPRSPRPRPGEAPLRRGRAPRAAVPTAARITPVAPATRTFIDPPGQLAASANRTRCAYAVSKYSRTAAIFASRTTKTTAYSFS